MERLPGVIFANHVNPRRNCWWWGGGGGGEGGTGGGDGGGGEGGGREMGYDRLVMNLEYLVFKIEQRKIK